MVEFAGEASHGVHQVHDYGATVIIADINEATLKEAGAALGPNAATVAVDVTNLDQMQAMYDDVIRGASRWWR